MVGGAAPHGDHRLPKRVMLGELENAEKRGSGGEGERMDGLRGRGSSEVWHHGGNTVSKGGYRFMAAWMREEEKASENRQRKRERETEEADKVEVAPGGHDSNKLEMF